MGEEKGELGPVMVPMQVYKLALDATNKSWTTLLLRVPLLLCWFQKVTVKSHSLWMWIFWKFSHVEILFEESPQLGSENQIWCDHNPITHYIGKMMKLSLSRIWMYMVGLALVCLKLMWWRKVSNLSYHALEDWCKP